MSTFKGRGLVIREALVGDSDKILTLLLKNTGKLSVSARGARKPKSKFLAGAQLFSYADFVIYDSGKFYSLCEITPLKNFCEICDDFEKLARGSLILEIADKTLMDKMPCDEMLYLMLMSLTRLCKAVQEPALISAAFELKYLQLHGYGAITEFCADCGDESISMHFGANGILCRSCASGNRTLRVSSDMLKAVNYILSSGIKDVFNFKTDRIVTHELQKASRLMMDTHFETRFKCREMIADEFG